ncbi:hypothetical protein [Jannaschia seohaensis]|uniref:Excalibur calcium-binding domain-containing protein n=1 Tax=Jannaschia seohaensis TaxID=475081 RepID=A0A2Y9AK85_9RHOB|nr:hypothetical protein [Jannaschia seohaensis]PWJ20469.1 hypothetical protein BCF38_103287 [Jannaschia seohaensis]SSA44565.1 hypothetical protein SAMN05421539_103287 [Jannaschia seohaensis]
MRRILPLFLLLTACGPSPQEARIEARRINGLSTAELWRIQATTEDEIELYQVEAELGSRNQFRSGAAYLGKRSLALARPGRWRRPRQDDPDLDAIDCSDFVLEAAAQAELMGSGGPRNDRHRLDEDGDGLACGWRSELERSVAAARRG